ncbi:MAG: adenine nucleotide alpha hydrolase [Pseudomonadota bacterium]
MTDALARLVDWFEGVGEVALAVSGGVDSMTLAHAAMQSRARVEVFHAVSPAVPEHATARVRSHAMDRGWDLTVVGAGEFGDDNYLKNPLNRCYFCKANLYDRLREGTDAVICSGTNTDDLGEYRPGLGAAGERAVRHPFVEIGVDKAGVRALAWAMGLNDLAELPAQPCLASRVETGLPIIAGELALIDRVERLMADALGPGDIRCRVTHQGVWIELAPDAIAAFPLLRPAVDDAVQEAGLSLAGVRPYRRGSAFLTEAAS